LPRESRKGLFIVGHSRSGKTELSSIIRLLLGGPIAAFSCYEFSNDKFCLQQLLGATGWIRDDAFNEGDWIDPQKYKTLVTGEPVDVRRMGIPALTGIRFEIPVCLTGNNLPFARDSSDAIYNRSLVVSLAVIRSEEEAATARLAVGACNGQTIGSCIYEEEAPGILLWALKGLVDLRDRGRFIVPDWISAEIETFKATNNPVAEWCKKHVLRDDAFMVERKDVACSYHGWQLDSEGSEAKALGARKFIPALRAALSGIGDFESHGRRYITGIRLTTEGLWSWDMHKKQDNTLKGGSKGYSNTKEEVNRRSRLEE
jgi:putative DNA primase/helicase